MKLPLPPKSFVMFASTSVPALLFPKAAVPKVFPPPVSFPMMESPGTALDAVALTTSNVLGPLMVTAPVNCTPEPLLFCTVRVSTPIVSWFSWIVLFEAEVKYPPYAVPSRSGWSVPLPSTSMLLFSRSDCGVPVPLPPTYAAPPSPSSESRSVPPLSVTALPKSEFSRATESLPPFPMVTGPVKAVLLPVSVTMPVEIAGTVSRPVPVILPLISTFAAVASLKSRAMSWKSFVPAAIGPENPPLLPVVPLSLAPGPERVMAFGMIEFNAANSAVPATFTAPTAGRPAALTEKTPEFTWVPPP